MRGTQFAQLTAFVAVAEHNSFTRAATHLGISTPSLSQTIRSLEEQFGVRLLDRTTRSVALTEAGEQLLAHLTPVLEGVQKALDAVNTYRDKPAGKLRLTVHPFAAATVLAPIVARFAAEYPEISLDICVDAARKDIVSERFDAGIHLGNCVDEDMIAVTIGGNFRVSTVASPDYLRRNPSLSVPEDLRQHNCITYGWTGSELGLPWRFKKANQQVEVPIKGSLTVNNVEFALRAGLDGIGIVQMPEASVSPLVADGQLATVLADWSPQWTESVLFYSSRRHVPVKLRVLVDFLRRQLKQSVRASRSGQIARLGELRDDVHLVRDWQAPISTLQPERKRHSNLEALSYRADGAIMKAAAVA
jgi:DNA-binding transcriptional LysR family regulator